MTNMGSAHKWHLGTIDHYNQMMYKTLLYESDVTSENLKTVEYENEEGLEFTARGYFARKDKNKYFIDEDMFSKLPIRIGVKFEEMKIKDDIVYRLLTKNSFKIVPEHSMEFREMVDGLCTFKHSAPDTWTLLKIIGIAGVCGKTFICIASNPELGKCHGKGTKILMADGSIKLVEDIKAGDSVMGVDSKPRNVIGTTKGVGELYLINQWSGEPYVVNDKHILCLRNNRDHNREIEISVEDYLKQHDTFKHKCKGYKVGVEFPERKVSLDPYMLGIWLGDGTLSEPSITTMDEEVVDEIRSFAKKNMLKVTTFIKKGVGELNKAKTYRLSNKIHGRKNVLTVSLRRYNLFRTEKNIPLDYLINSREIRLQLLAGIIDSDGYLIKKGKLSSTFEIIQKNPRFIDNVAYLCRSLGLRANTSVKKVKYNGEYRDYFRVKIGGNIHIIPNKVNRKKAEERIRVKASLNTAFQVNPLGRGDYYGFQVDNDGKYLLGDFTVTHNSSVFDVLHGLTNMSPVFKPRSVPGVLAKINGNGNLVFDDVLEARKEVREILEEFNLQIAGDKHVYINGAMKSKDTKSSYNCPLQSITYTYNTTDCYKEPDKKYFDNMFHDNNAIDSRFLKLKLYGVLEERFGRDFDMVKEATDNRDLYLRYVKEIIWIQEAKKRNEIPRRWVTNTMLQLKGRRRNVYNELTLFIDMYCQSQDEYDRYISLLDGAVIGYKEMVNGIVPTHIEEEKVE